MSIFGDLRKAINNLASLDKLFDPATQQRASAYDLRYQYYAGEHRRQLKSKPGQADDNLSANFSGLAVDRSVSMLVGAGIEFDLENEAAEEYLAEVWEANKKDILLHRAAQHASISGTGYIKIIPDGVESKRNPGRLLPRLVVLDPRQLTIETNPEDMEQVERYIIRFNITDPAGHERARRETIERQYAAVTGEAEQITGFTVTGWVIRNEITDLGGKWTLMSEEAWPYEFAPVIHWQNLPDVSDAYGSSDLDDVLELQDRYNFVQSNINRIIRYHAHPRTIMFGVAAGQISPAAGVDNMWLVPDPTARAENLEMQSDLASSRAFALDLRQSLFDITRTVDLSSISDKLGSLTNFGLRTLFYDALQKLETKRALLGEALEELNHRLLVLAGVNPNDGGKVVFGDPLPVNEAESVQALNFDLQSGLASKETVSKERGYDYAAESERLAGEKETEQAQGDNIGALLLRNFQNGGGAE